MTLRSLTVCGALLASQLLAVAPAAHAADAPSHWTAAWATALQPIPQLSVLPPLYQAPEVGGRTVRQIVYPTLSGRAVRIHLSNAYGKAPLVIESLRIARSAGGAAVDARTDAQVRFGGKTAVTLPPGGEIDSDPVGLEVAAGTPYAVSSTMGAAQKMVAWHRVSSQTNYVSAPGDHSADASGAAFRGRFTHYAWVTAISVEDPASVAVAAIGDSITDGMRSTLNENRRWPDALARRLEQAGDRSVGVINLGISGNRLLNDSPCYGDALERRFGRDVLQRPGVRAAVLLIGINDINFPSTAPHAGLDCDFPHTAVSAADLIAGYQRVIAGAHRRGVRVFGATLTPAELPPPREAIREAVNRWIRTSHAFDGVVDFDAALRDPSDPDRLQRGYDSGDHIHPSDSGYAAMAATVPVQEIMAAARK